MKEKIRLLSYYDDTVVEAGCDEAGRGCLAGPVFAAAVIFPKDYYNSVLDDSKKLSEKKRTYIRSIIEEEALSYSVGFVEPKKIDAINIHQASYLAMHLALNNLSIIPQHIIVDGNKFVDYKRIPHTCLIKGDGKYLSIAAASILAKTYRDEYMLNLAKNYPMFGWDKNKGYPTIYHRLALQQYGPTPHHRLSFKVKKIVADLT